MTDEQMALHAAADEAWEVAWDEAREADAAARRRYNRHAYAEAALLAKTKILKACTCVGCTDARERAAKILAEL